MFTLYAGISAISSLLQGGCHLTQHHSEFLTVQGAETRAIHYLALRDAANLSLNQKKASLWGTARQGEFLQRKVTLSSRWLEFQLPLTHLVSIHCTRKPCGFYLITFTFLVSLLLHLPFQPTGLLSCTKLACSSCNHFLWLLLLTTHPSFKTSFESYTEM